MARSANEESLSRTHSGDGFPLPEWVRRLPSKTRPQSITNITVGIALRATARIQHGAADPLCPSATEDPADEVANETPDEKGPADRDAADKDPIDEDDDSLVLGIDARQVD
jgi:hypothetical protein